MKNGLNSPARLACWLVAVGTSIASVSAAAADFPAATFSAEGTKMSLSFDGKGEFRLKDDQKLLVLGHYWVKGQSIRLTDESGPWACKKGKENSGSYHWTYDQSMLSFKTVTDRCTDRANSLNGSKWKEKP